MSKIAFSHETSLGKVFKVDWWMPYCEIHGFFGPEMAVTKKKSEVMVRDHVRKFHKEKENARLG